MPTPLTDLRGLALGGRFLAALPAYLRAQTPPEEASSRHRDWLARRPERFLEFTRRTAFDRPHSVTGRLLAHAGVDAPELEELVGREGLEGALRQLFAAGVYVTVDEFKGRAPLVRGSLRLEMGPEDLENPLASSHVAAGSGGSRSRAAPFLMDLEYVRACGVVTACHFEAHGITDAHKATWEAPGAGSRFRLLKLASFGRPPIAWFTPVDPKDPDLDAVFRIGELALRLGARLSGVPLPRPVVATGLEPLPVARWMREVLDAGGTPHLFGPTSAGVCLSLAAVEAGLDLTGAYMTCGGEPTTEARRRSIVASGLAPLPRYGTIEAGPIGYACARPEHPDHLHVVEDLHAIVQPGDDHAAPELPSSAVLLTTLHEAAPYCMLNLSMGDEATLEPSACGCGNEAAGWRTVIHSIRSFEKFTAAGVTFHEGDVIRLLEETLPDRFGGGPADYQLVESDGADGVPRLRILVDPGVGDIDETDLREALLDGLGDASPVARVMQRHLAGSTELSVERQAPLRTRSGKVMHLHVENRGS